MGCVRCVGCVPASRAMALMQSLPLSATYSVLLLGDRATPYGQENLAVCVGPSCSPRFPPATVVAVPASSSPHPTPREPLSVSLMVTLMRAPADVILRWGAAAAAVGEEEGGYEWSTCEVMNRRATEEKGGLGCREGKL